MKSYIQSHHHNDQKMMQVNRVLSAAFFSWSILPPLPKMPSLVVGNLPNIPSLVVDTSPKMPSLIADRRASRGLCRVFGISNPREGLKVGRPPSQVPVVHRVFLRCESKAEADTCFARFHVCNSSLGYVAARPLTCVVQLSLMQ